ncbi:acyl carrier protein phosphodiesterase [Sulfurovum sp. zt1-1]|uniref:Acyl carrier protein phosphodiesterase n=1 Tax=Sulfurovum zhangzhouensis TaxID=3019067 RepID=A0ABT7QY30_9BACT|nr:acyl carrier protein phosphodiesterase [Sulfurovum zhangzhouensis]MDM5271737.1 acyl carrier protein phosphodiesterase [Sulfurovum zhangzhouensis]
MNWLAHVLLSEDKVDFQLGNYLADPLKGRAWESASDDLQRGITVHKLIDSYTDTHKIVSLSKSRLRAQGLLRGVVIDLTYDYLLSKHWEKFTTIPKERFLSEFYENAEKRAPSFPEQPQLLVNNLIKQDRLNKYNSLEELHKALMRIDTRLSPRLLARESASSYIDDIVRMQSRLEQDFLDFFPELCIYLKVHMDDRYIKHWRVYE